MLQQVHRLALAGAVLAFGLTTGACSSLQSVRNSKEPGYAHRFAVPYGKILDAAPPALQAVQMTIIDTSDPVPGKRVIMARHGISAGSWGEYVRVTITERDAGHTDVAIFTRSLQAFRSSSSTPEYFGDLLLEIGKRVLGT
jgi:hypothetical protein